MQKVWTSINCELEPIKYRLVEHMDPESDSMAKENPEIQDGTPDRNFLCRLTEKGAAQKVYLYVPLTNELHMLLFVLSFTFNFTPILK